MCGVCFSVIVCRYFNTVVCMSIVAFCLVCSSSRLQCDFEYGVIRVVFVFSFCSMRWASVLVCREGDESVGYSVFVRQQEVCHAPVYCKHCDWRGSIQF